jgi:death on curing protein
MIGYAWLSKDLIFAIHGEQLAEHGGPDGVSNMKMLDSCIERPRLMFTDEACSDPAVLAAAYAFGIIQNRPFVDGKKRMALLSAEMFLEMNGYQLTATDKDCVLTILELVDGTLPENELIEWFQKNVQPV